MSDAPYIAVVDLEATGLEAPEHAPIEFGEADLVATSIDILGAVTEWGRVTLPRSRLLSPGRPIPPEASAIHHLVDEDLATAPPWRFAFEALHIDAEHCRAFAAHSAKTDRQWLSEFTGAIPWICSWKCALRAWPDAPAHSNQALRYWLKPEGLDREQAMPAHRAGPDAYVTAFLLRELLKLHPLERLVQWTEEPAVLIRVPFGKYTRGMRWTDVDNDFLYWVLDRDFEEDVLFTVRAELGRRRQEREAEQAPQEARS